MSTTSRPTRSRSLAAVLVALVLAATAAVAPSAATPRAGGSTGSVAAPSLVEPPAPDPGALGPDAVDTLSYDLGDQAFQPDGFPAKVELKGEVYAPQTIVGAAPLVILVHGRHATCATATRQALEWPCPAAIPEVPSYLGYAKLATLLASHGMVVVSIGANGINANDAYLDDGGASARGQLILEHLRRWQAWNASATDSPFGTRFVGHIDLSDVGLMGHSRGGEGVVAAAQLNQRIGVPFGIKAVMALAPVDFGRRVLGGVPLGVILPYCDGDVSDLQGADYYDDSRYASPGDPAAKMTTLLYGANHNFFNTVWTTGPGSFDDAGLMNTESGGTAEGATASDTCATGGAARLAAANQEQAGATLMAGFFRRYLSDDADFQRFVTGTAPFPASTGSARWSVAFHAPTRLDVERFDTPATYRTNRFGQPTDLQAVSPGVICNPGGMDFGSEQRALDAIAQRCGSPEGLAATNDTGVLDAGWIRPNAVVRESLGSAGRDVSAFDSVRFRVAVTNDSRNATRAKQDVTVVLTDTQGHRASVAVGARTNALLPLPQSNVQHAVLNGVRIPTSAFAGVDLTHIRTVELAFDKTNAGRLSISDLAFTREDTGDAVGPTSGGATTAAVRPECRRTPAARWACSIAQLLWGRDPNSNELTRLARGYSTAAGRRTAIASAVASPSAALLHETRFGERYTQAPISADPTAFLTAAGRAHWDVGVVELVDALTYSSGGVASTRGIIESAYQAFTGRSADASGLAYWTPRVDESGPRALATSLAKTTAYRGRVVDQRYREIVGRAADPSGRAYWVAKLATVGGEQLLVRSLLDTGSFQTAAIA